MSKQTNVEGNNRIMVNDNIMSVALAFCGCLGCVGIIASENSISYTNSFLAVLIFGLGLYVIRSVIGEFRSNSLRDKLYAYIFSMIFSTALHMGAQLEMYENVDFKNLWLYLGSICFAVFLAPIVDRLWKCVFDSAKDVKKNDEKPFRLTAVWMIIFALWIPTFLAFFPGAFVYDARDEYLEVFLGQYTMHHPLLHVLVLGGLVAKVGEGLGFGANAGIAIYTLIQMAIMSLIFAYMIMVLQRFGARKKYLLGVIVFLGLFPVFPMYAVCSAKDTLFTGAFLVAILMILQFVKEPKEFFRNRSILFVVASVFMMLLRNNGAYAYIVAIPFTALCLLSGIEKKQWAKLAILMILSVVLYKGSEYCLKTATNASDNEHQEMLTVPIQQLARVYKYAPDTFSQEDIDTLYEVLPENYLITYTARCSDVLKSGFDNDTYAANPGKYRKLWMKVGLKKPLIYINAWLVNSYGYWYPDMLINVYGGNEVYTFQYRDSSYFGFETEPPGVRKSLFPLYERFYRNVSLELFQQKVPVVSMLFAPGFVFWIFMFCFAGFMRKKNWKVVASLIPVLLLVGTVLLGPTVLVRYVLILWCISAIYPVLAADRQ